MGNEVVLSEHLTKDAEIKTRKSVKIFDRLVQIRTATLLNRNVETNVPSTAKRGQNLDDPGDSDDYSA
jgi:hypothetical protein